MIEMKDGLKEMENARGVLSAFFFFVLRNPTPTMNIFNRNHKNNSNPLLFDELMSLFRRRGELVASGFSLDMNDIRQRADVTVAFVGFISGNDARMRKIHDVCKRTHWTLVTRENLLATHADIVAQVTNFATSERNYMDLMNHVMADLDFEYNILPPIPLGLLRPFKTIDEIPALLMPILAGFLLCRVISPLPMSLNGVHFVAEDCEGNVFWVHALKQPCFSPEWAARKAPRGLIVGIVSPSLSLTSFGWHPLIRCHQDDSFQPIHDVSSPLLNDTPWFVAPCETALEWKERGNECFARRDYDGAAAAYTRGIALECDNIDLLSNLANALIQRGKWKAALIAADCVLAIDANHLKCGRFRAVALGNLQRYRDASSAWMRAAILNRDSPDKKAECTANAAKAMVAQRQTEGVFDWPSLGADIFADRRVDMATYKSSAIHVAPTTIKGRGFGMFAREAIPRGTLLVVDVPLAGVLELNERYLCDKLLLEAEKDEFVMETLVELCKAPHIANQSRPTLGAQVAELALCHLDRTHKRWSGHFDDGNELRNLGLFRELVRFNHSCAPNCVKTILGNVLVIQTVIDVAAGSELFVSLCYLDDLRHVRQEALMHTRHFTCHCTRCHLEATDPDLVRIGAQVRAICDGTSKLPEAKLRALVTEVAHNSMARHSFRWKLT
jgi:tetratricopeptide (TPR) repeat protein